MNGFDVKKTAKKIQEFQKNPVMLDLRDFSTTTGMSLQEAMESLEKDPTSLNAQTTLVAFVWIGTRKYIDGYTIDDAWSLDFETITKVMMVSAPPTPGSPES